MMTFRKLAVVCAVSVFALNGALAQDKPAAPFTPQSGQAGKDVVWVPSPQALVDKMLDMAQVTKDDYLVDLGAGDGRTVITAAKRGLRAHGIEYNPQMVALAKDNAKKEGVADRATFVEADIFVSDFSKASVITLFLLEGLNVKLRPTLLQMRPGTRVVSNSFRMGDWQPDETFNVTDNCTSWCTAHKWIVPAQVGGTWNLQGGNLSLLQSYQMLQGTLTVGGKAMPISDAKMTGADISFTADGKRYTGRVEGAAIKGSIQGGGSWSATRA